MVSTKGEVFTYLIFSSRTRLHFVMYNITEQYTKEEQDVCAVAEEISELDTKDLESSAKVVFSKDSLLLSLVDDISEMIVQSPVPEEASPEIYVDDSAIKGDVDDKKTSRVDISTHG